jgi:hypothetical protein
MGIFKSFLILGLIAGMAGAGSLRSAFPKEPLAEDELDGADVFGFRFVVGEKEFLFSGEEPFLRSLTINNVFGDNQVATYVQFAVDVVTDLVEENVIIQRREEIRDVREGVAGNEYDAFDLDLILRQTSHQGLLSLMTNNYAVYQEESVPVPQFNDFGLPVTRGYSQTARGSSGVGGNHGSEGLVTSGESVSDPGASLTASPTTIPVTTPTVTQLTAPAVQQLPAPTVPQFTTPTTLPGAISLFETLSPQVPELAAELPELRSAAQSVPSNTSP